jgi:lipopolysaccharide export system protein LptA
MILNMKKPKPNYFFVILIWPLISFKSYALPEDRNEVLQLNADTADLNQEAHKGTYIGNVQLDQGSTHVRAAEAVTKANQKNQLTQAIAKGNHQEQAHYWTIPEKDKPPIHAFADTIFYFPDRHLIELVGNARIEQGNNSFSAPKISYDTEKQHVITEKQGELRTTIIFHPEKKA